MGCCQSGAVQTPTNAGGRARYEMQARGKVVEVGAGAGQNRRKSVQEQLLPPDNASDGAPPPPAGAPTPPWGRVNTDDLLPPDAGQKHSKLGNVGLSHRLRKQLELMGERELGMNRVESMELPSPQGRGSTQTRPAYKRDPDELSTNECLKV